MCLVSPERMLIARSTDTKLITYNPGDFWYLLMCQNV